jgi:hypothetical protein
MSFSNYLEQTVMNAIFNNASPAYLDEVAFRFNNRSNPYLFRDTLLRLIEGDALPFKELVGH